MTPRLGISKKIRAALADSQYDGVVAVGPDNVQYLTGVQLPFHAYNPDRFAAVFWPRTGNPVCVAHAEWVTTLSQGRIPDVIPYLGDTPAAVEALAISLAEQVTDRVPDAVMSRIGMDLNRTPGHLYAAVRRVLPRVIIEDATEWFVTLRMHKTSAELALLDEVAYRTDHGILGATHHMMANAVRPEKGAAEIIRVHCLEREMDFIGYDFVAEVASGEHARKFWPVAPSYGVGLGKTLGKGEFLRMAISATMDGYRSDGCRLMVMGEPTDAQMEAYDALVWLRELAVRTMVPGVRCCDVYRTVCQAAQARSLPLVHDLGIGHGVGVTAFEAPYLTESDTTALSEGMVLVVDLIVLGPNEELLRTKDTVIIRESGAEVIGWYKDWREPYIASMSFPSGGG